MEDRYKEVYLGQYCKTCRFEKDSEDDVNSPCWDCLQQPMNVHSHKPVKYERAERGHVEPKAKRKGKD